MELLLDASVYGPEPLGLKNILIAGGEIIWIGSEKLDLPSHLPVHTTDLGGKRIIPGLIDGHVHVTGGGGEAGYASSIPPVPLNRFTQGGVTTVVGVLGTDDLVRTPASLVAQCRALGELGLDAYCHTGGYHVPPVTLTGSIRSDIVHIDRIIGVGEVAISDHRSSQPTLDEILRIASESHVAGLMTKKAGILHLHIGDGDRGLDLIRQALKKSELPPRVFNPTHVNRRKELFEEALELTQEGVSIDITAFPVGPEENAWSAEDALKLALDSDIDKSKISISSDGGGCLPSFDEHGQVTHMDIGDPSALTQCLKNLLDSGQDLASVLPSMTSNPADLLRFPNKGRIRQGASADLVVLNSDNEICDVMVKGDWHILNGQSQRLDFASWNTTNQKGTSE